MIFHGIAKRQQLTLGISILCLFRQTNNKLHLSNEKSMVFQMQNLPSRCRLCANYRFLRRSPFLDFLSFKSTFERPHVAKIRYRDASRSEDESAPNVTISRSRITVPAGLRFPILFLMKIKKCHWSAAILTSASSASSRKWSRN